MCIVPTAVYVRSSSRVFSLLKLLRLYRSAAVQMDVAHTEDKLNLHEGRSRSSVKMRVSYEISQKIT